MSAVISECGQYRYRLTREIQPGGYSLLYIMLNPSTADASKDDPTIRKCMGFAKRHNASKITVVNLFAWRATKPAELKKVADPVGPINDHHIAHAIATSSRVIVAWGAQPIARTRVEMLLKIAGHQVLESLGRNIDGSPPHPLMLPYSTPLEQWRPNL